MYQLVQVAGSLAILTSFALSQCGWLATTSRLYLLLNFAGSAVLAGEAAQGRQWGFLVLEGAWAVVSAVGLARALRTPRSQLGSTGRASH